MQERDVLDNRQPQSDPAGLAATRRIGSIERLGHAIEFSRRDSRVVVFDDDPQRRAIVFNADARAVYGVAQYGLYAMGASLGRVFVTHCNASAVCNAAIQDGLAVQHAAYMAALK